MLGQNDFLKLMVAQLQAQNPLEPGNSNEYLNELAQFTQVEQIDQPGQRERALGRRPADRAHRHLQQRLRRRRDAGPSQSVQSDASGTTSPSKASPA